MQVSSTSNSNQQTHPIKKFILIVVIFVIVVFSGDRLCAIGLEKLISYSNNRFITNYTGKAKSDVLVIGNSRADRHLPVKQIQHKTGLTVNNLGLGGISMVLSEILFHDYVDRYGPPKLLVIETSNLKTDPTQIADFRLFSIYSDRIRQLNRQYSPEHYFIAQWFHLFNFNNELLFRASADIFRNNKDRRHHKIISDKMIENFKNQPQNKAKRNAPLNEQALLRLIAFCTENNIALRILVTPYLQIEGKPNGNISQWINHLQTLIGKPQPIWDYSTLVHETNRFRDSKHLNTRGVDRLLEKMQQDRFFDL